MIFRVSDEARKVCDCTLEIEDLSAGNVLRWDDVGCGEKACQEDNKWGKVSMDGSQTRSNYDILCTPY